MKKGKLLLACILEAALICGCSGSDYTPEKDSETKAVKESEIIETTETEGYEQEKATEENASECDKIYSYLQGVKSYEKGLDWTGEWCYIEAGGQTFSQFGCGICCISNMYSTMSGSECDPQEMYMLARNNTSYNPESGVGAISWSQVDQLCDSLGINGKLYERLEIEDFRNLASRSETVMVLVSSEFDDRLWENIPGHYVNIWDYCEEDDTVFLTDSKGPTNNRKRVTLEEVFSALKLSSEYQCYAVE